MQGKMGMSSASPSRDKRWGESACHFCKADKNECMKKMFQFLDSNKTYERLKKNYATSLVGHLPRLFDCNHHQSCFNVHKLIETNWLVLC
jgi:hypothetical protein